MHNSQIFMNEQKGKDRHGKRRDELELTIAQSQLRERGEEVFRLTFAAPPVFKVVDYATIPPWAFGMYTHVPLHCTIHKLQNIRMSTS